MVGFSAYYLLSPLNFILVFFSLETLPVAIEIISLIKIGLCGLTFYIFISQKENTVAGLLFSTAYALMSYNIVYESNIMWLDGVILLPIIILGIKRIVNGKSAFIYLFSLSLSILINYYIGFMTCIFSVLYFLYYYFFEDIRDKFWNFKIVWKYALASLLAGGLGMFLLLPVLKSLSRIL